MNSRDLVPPVNSVFIFNEGSTGVLRLHDSNYRLHGSALPVVKVQVERSTCHYRGGTSWLKYAQLVGLKMPYILYKICKTRGIMLVFLFMIDLMQINVSAVPPAASRGATLGNPLFFISLAAVYYIRLPISLKIIFSLVLCGRIKLL